MLFSSKVGSLLRQAGHVDALGKNVPKIERNVVAHCTSASYSIKVDYDKLEVPSRYQDVPISNKSYFEFVWENREKHFNKVAMVSTLKNNKLLLLLFV